MVENEPRKPRTGEVLKIGVKASVQFKTPIIFRVIRPHEWSTYQGWIWLDGYQLNPAGDAIERRSIFVQLAGLEPWRGPELFLPEEHSGALLTRRRPASQPRPRQS